MNAIDAGIEFYRSDRNLNRIESKVPVRRDNAKLSQWDPGNGSLKIMDNLYGVFLIAGF